MALRQSTLSKKRSFTHLKFRVLLFTVFLEFKSFYPNNEQHFSIETRFATSESFFFHFNCNVDELLYQRIFK